MNKERKIKMLITIIVLLSLILIVFGIIALGIVLNHKDSKKSTKAMAETIGNFLVKYNNYLSDIYKIDSKILDYVSGIYYDMESAENQEKPKA